MVQLQGHEEDSAQKKTHKKRKHTKKKDAAGPQVTQRQKRKAHLGTTTELLDTVLLLLDLLAGLGNLLLETSLREDKDEKEGLLIRRRERLMRGRRLFQTKSSVVGGRAAKKKPSSQPEKKNRRLLQWQHAETSPPPFPERKTAPVHAPTHGATKRRAITTLLLLFTHPDDTVLRLELLHGIKVVVDQTEPSGLPTTKLSAEAKEANARVVVDIVHLGELLAKLSLRFREGERERRFSTKPLGARIHLVKFPSTQR